MALIASRTRRSGSVDLSRTVLSAVASLVLSTTKSLAKNHAHLIRLGRSLKPTHHQANHEASHQVSQQASQTVEVRKVKKTARFAEDTKPQAGFPTTSLITSVKEVTEYYHGLVKSLQGEMKELCNEFPLHFTSTSPTTSLKEASECYLDLVLSLHSKLEELYDKSLLSYTSTFPSSSMMRAKERHLRNLRSVQDKMKDLCFGSVVEDVVRQDLTEDDFDSACNWDFYLAMKDGSEGRHVDPDKINNNLRWSIMERVWNILRIALCGKDIHRSLSIYPVDFENDFVQLFLGLHTQPLGESTTLEILQRREYLIEKLHDCLKAFIVDSAESEYLVDDLCNATCKLIGSLEADHEAEYKFFVPDLRGINRRLWMRGPDSRFQVVHLKGANHGDASADIIDKVVFGALVRKVRESSCRNTYVLEAKGMITARRLSGEGSMTLKNLVEQYAKGRSPPMREEENKEEEAGRRSRKTKELRIVNYF